MTRSPDGLTDINEWVTVEHALRYLKRADQIPHRAEGEALLLQLVPMDVERVLDLGTGDGRLLALLRIDRPKIKGVALDISPTMLRATRERFGEDVNIQVVRHDLEASLPDLGRFDAVVSAFAIHHVSDRRKKALYSEVHAALSTGGIFCNLEHVAPASPAIHARFLRTVGITEADEDPSNKLVPAETQLRWFREIGYREVDCHWKWLELALLAGTKQRCSPKTSGR